MDQRTYPMWCDANDGGIKRGDRASTGDLAARPKETVGLGGSHLPPDRTPAPETGSADALAETVDEGAIDNEDVMEESSLDPLDQYDPRDPVLGFTNMVGNGPEDWAADTGPTVSADAEGDSEVEVIPDEPTAVPKPVKKAAAQRKTPQVRKK